jgi:hypothetical protein
MSETRFPVSECLLSQARAIATQLPRDAIQMASLETVSAGMEVMFGALRFELARAKDVEQLWSRIRQMRWPGRWGWHHVRFWQALVGELERVTRAEGLGLLQIQILLGMVESEVLTNLPEMCGKEVRQW